MAEDNREKKYWLDDPGNATKIFRAVCALSAIAFAADAFYHKHAYFEAEEWFGFYGVFSFVACVGLVLAAKLLRKILFRPEDYYDD